MIVNKVKTLRLGHPDTYNEAPPLNLRGITSWPWGTTMTPSWNYVLTWGTTTKPSWNYVLFVRHYHKTFMKLCPGHEAPTRNLREITSLHEAPPWTLTEWFMELCPLDEAPPSTLTTRFMELRPLDKVPPWTLTRKVMELRPTHTLSMFHQ